MSKNVILTEVFSIFPTYLIVMYPVQFFLPQYCSLLVFSIAWIQSVCSSSFYTVFVLIRCIKLKCKVKSKCLNYMYVAFLLIPALSIGR